jgi:hypothetical protein
MELEKIRSDALAPRHSSASHNNTKNGGLQSALWIGDEVTDNQVDGALKPD